MVGGRSLPMGLSDLKERLESGDQRLKEYWEHEFLGSR